MLISRPPRTRLSPAHLALGVAALALMSVLAKLLVRGDVRFAILGVLVAASPALGYVALRWPVIFPLGLYLLLVPVDGLLVLSAGGTLTKFVGIAAIGALVLRGLLTRRFLRPPASYYTWGALIGYMFLTAFWTIDAELTFSYLPIMGSLFALYTALAFYPITYLEYRWIRRTTILAGILTACYGLYANATGQQMVDLRHHTNARLSLSVGDLHFDPNQYSAFFMIPSAFIVAGFLTDRRLSMRVAYAATFALFSTNVFLSGSRGGTIGMGLLVLFLGIRTRKYLATALVLIGGLLISFAIPNVWARFADPTQGEGSGRNEIWATGLRGLHEFWLFGAGLATFPTVYDRYVLQTYQHNFAGWHRPGHNLFMSALVELGVVGTVLVIVAWWSSIRQNRSIPRGHPLFTFRIACEAAMLAIFWMAMTIDVMFFKYLWVALAFSMLLANVHRPRPLAGATGYVSNVGGGTKERTRRMTDSTPARLESIALAPEI